MGALHTASGLALVVLRSGPPGPTPSPEATVTVNYRGWTADGVQFDSSWDRGVAATFPLRAVIPGWTEGVQQMHAGDVVRMWIPEALAYKGLRPPLGPLIFDVELLSFREPAPPMGARSSRPVPEDVGGPPYDAQRTPSGLAFRPLRESGATDHPSPRARVTVNYSGWTTDGVQFDSSWDRGRSATLPLDGVIPGWTEALQRMSPGDTVRFWIPAELAYKDKPGRPAGMLVFDVELLSYEEPSAAP